MQYIQLDISVRLPIKDLSNYEATTIQQAAANQARWYDKEAITLEELIACGEAISQKFTGIEENSSTSNLVMGVDKVRPSP